MRAPLFFAALAAALTAVYGVEYAVNKAHDQRITRVAYDAGVIRGRLLGKCEFVHILASSPTAAEDIALRDRVVAYCKRVEDRDAADARRPDRGIR